MCTKDLIRCYIIHFCYDAMLVLFLWFVYRGSRCMIRMQSIVLVLFLFNNVRYIAGACRCVHLHVKFLRIEVKHGRKMRFKSCFFQKNNQLVARTSSSRRHHQVSVSPNFFSHFIFLIFLNCPLCYKIFHKNF